MARLRNLLLLALVVSLGCQRAERYGEQVATQAPGEGTGGAKETVKPEPLDPGIQWIDPGARWSEVGTPIKFVHIKTQPAEWHRLQRFWNPSPLSTPHQVASFAGLPRFAAAAVVASTRAPAVKIKVPLGLDDPILYMPVGSTLTVPQWELGRRLFFDDGWLEDRRGRSCATCHIPGHGYADTEQAYRDGFNTPTLVNCVFNRRQFWDGRVALLEEVVQEKLEDERQPSRPERFRHVWHGVIGRLRADPSYKYQFRQAFGTLPTQDALGRALAAYLRTLLAGDSLHDRAEQLGADKGRTILEAYKEVLDRDPALREGLDRAGKSSADVAAEVFHGYRLFHNLDERRRANCLFCHNGRTFTDHLFHNLGIGPTPLSRGEETGRFRTAPIGRKERNLIGAFKTPTLRGLLRTRPYLHTGEMKALPDVVTLHTKGGRWNEYLDPLLLVGPDRPRDINLNNKEIEALVLFLRALNGMEIDSSVRKPPGR